MPILTPPLKRMTLTQPYGVDYLGNNGPGGRSYADIGLRNGHNGWDLSCPTGTELLAVCDGEGYYAEGGQGYGNDYRIRSKELGLEIVYGHLLKKVKTGPVKAGEVIALSDNTGFSTGPHLHLGIRRAVWGKDGSGPTFPDAANGFYGYIDPAQFFAAEVFSLPVDRCYGLTPLTKGVPSEAEWQKTNEWVFRNLKRLLTVRETKALRFGFWDLRTVLDPAMFHVWSEMHKPEAMKRGIVK